MEVSQFTYFQQCGGFDLNPISVELTYGLERLAMYIQGVDNVFDLTWVEGITYRDVYHRNEVEQSQYNFEHADTDLLLSMFDGAMNESIKLSGVGLALPAYDQAMKCSHLFNLLDARGAISVAERAQYIGRIRTLALRSAQAWQGINPDEEAAK
jgi:glycyl-tRNA synthetase alpha chain